MKKFDLCERAYCRERWEFLLTWWDPYFGGRLVKLRVCAAHAEPYTRTREPDVCGRVVTAVPRSVIIT